MSNFGFSDLEISRNLEGMVSASHDHSRMPKKWRIAASTVSLGLLVGAVAGPVVLAEPAHAVSHWSGGGVTISGKQWLRGKGVSVYRSRQCTELAFRMYAQKGWGRLYNIYGMQTKRVYDGKLTFHRNGSGYKPVPGDVLVELGGSYQHVAVVNRVTKGKIYTVEQNATASGRHVYSWNGRTAKGAYGPRHVGGFIHSKKNPFGKPAKKPTKKPAKSA